MRTSDIKLVVIFTLFIGLNSLLAQNKKTIQLYKIQKSKAVNRTLKTIDSNNIKYLNISENKKEGLVWLDTKEFKNGIIEIKMRGKDELQKSFIGIAFHAKNNSVYDAIYCRLFNFMAKIRFDKFTLYNMFRIQNLLGENSEMKKMRIRKRN